MQRRDNPAVHAHLHSVPNHMYDLDRADDDDPALMISRPGMGRPGRLIAQLCMQQQGSCRLCSSIHCLLSENDL